MTFALLAGIVATSVVGSVHCLAMCGPLVGLHGGAATTRLAITHSLGRLTTYVLFGAIAGAVGSAVDLAGRVGNIQRAATLLAAGLIAAVGIAQLVQAYVRHVRARTRARRDHMQLNCISSRTRNDSNMRRLAFAPALVQADANVRRSTGNTEPVQSAVAATAVGSNPSALAAGAIGAERSAFAASVVGADRSAFASSAGGPKSSAFASALVRIRPKSAAKRSYLIGTLTGLLPCGWLWAFVIAAAGTASVTGGAAVMFAFWLGTVPAMVGLLRVTGPLLARIRVRMPAITAVALIVLGLGTLALRWRDAGVTQVDKPHCHCHGAAS
jgi:sulfite exporter TauE/SafE